MGSSLLIIGFILLMNPVVHVIDILPDFIGFFLISKALYKSSFLNVDIKSARSGFIKLGFVELIRFFCILLYGQMDNTGVLLFTFTFGIIELILFIPALEALFEGYSRLAMMYNGTSLYVKKSKKSHTELAQTVKKLTLTVYIMRVVMTCLPEFTALQMYDSIGEVSALALNYTEYRNMMYILFGMILIIFAVICAVNTIRFYKGVGKDTTLNKTIDDIFKNDILTKESLFTAKKMQNVMSILVLTVATSFVLYSNGINILIGAISSALMLILAIMIAEYSKLALAVIPLTLARGIMAVVNFMKQVNYYKEEMFDESSVKYSTDAYELYHSLTTTEAIEYILAIASFFVVLFAISQIIKKHISDSGIHAQSVNYSKQAHDLELYNTVGAKLLVNMIIMIINFILATAYPTALSSINSIGMINSVVTLIWVAHTVYLVIYVDDNLYKPMENGEI